MRQEGWSRRCSGVVGDDSQFVDNVLAHWKQVKAMEQCGRNISEHHTTVKGIYVTSSYMYT